MVESPVIGTQTSQCAPAAKDRAVAKFSCPLTHDVRRLAGGAVSNTGAAGPDMSAMPCVPNLRGGTDAWLVELHCFGWHACCCESPCMTPYVKSRPIFGLLGTLGVAFLSSLLVGGCTNGGTHTDTCCGEVIVVPNNEAARCQCIAHDSGVPGDAEVQNDTDGDAAAHD